MTRTVRYSNHHDAIFVYLVENQITSLYKKAQVLAEAGRAGPIRGLRVSRVQGLLDPREHTIRGMCIALSDVAPDFEQIVIGLSRANDDWQISPRLCREPVLRPRAGALLA